MNKGWIILCCLLLQGCIRLTADAGYWHSHDETVKGKHVHLDTQELIPHQKAPEDIRV